MDEVCAGSELNGAQTIRVVPHTPGDLQYLLGTRRPSDGRISNQPPQGFLLPDYSNQFSIVLNGTRPRGTRSRP